MSGVDTFASAKAQANITAIIAGLRTKHQTRDELQCLLGVSKPTMRRYLEHLRTERRIFIRAWRSGTRGRFAPVYAPGAGMDMPEPAGMTKHERNAMEWRRVKSCIAKHDRVKSVARVHKTIQRVRSKPQPWFAALMRAA